MVAEPAHLHRLVEEREGWEREGRRGEKQRCGGHG
jgi:hypothetical protein